MTDSINHNFASIRTDSSLILYLLKKYWKNLWLLIKTVVNKNKNIYYYNIFLEKGSNKDKFNTQYF